MRRDRSAARRSRGWLAGLLLAFAAWMVLYSLWGGDPLGVWPTPDWLSWLGWSLAGCGLTLTVVGQAHLGRSWRIGIDDRPTDLVTGGIYRLIRNPIFAGMLLMVGGNVLVTPSPWTIMAWLAVAALIGVQTRAEEDHLDRRHGERYRAYAAAVGRFVPGLGRLRAGTRRTDAGGGRPKAP